jgi:polysaccharide export outer membrane protein
MSTRPFLTTIRHHLVLVFSLLMMLILSACSSSQAPLAESSTPPPSDYSYVIGPGDTLEIFVWDNPELSSTSTVRPDGKLTTRLVEDMEVSGKTSTELAREIEQAYSVYVREPVVSVIVREFNGMPEQQVRVIGEATSPQSVPYSRGMTLLDLMIAVGGMTEFADGNRSVLIRNVDGQQRSYALRLDDLLKRGDISANLTLDPGDVVIISESWF